MRPQELPPARLVALALLTPALAAALLVIPAAAQPDKDRAAKPRQDERLAGLLDAVRAEHKVPAVFGAVVGGGRLLAVAAVGVRKAGSPEAVTVDDRVHLGSDTKAMTATVVALLVEKKKLRWDSTVGQVLPGLKGKIHADYLGVTVEELLAHRGGVVPDVDWRDAPRGRSTREHRLALVPIILKEAPAAKPGAKFVYSNASPVVASEMAEAAADESWENLMTETLFRPLGMRRAGFGPPGAKGKVEEPWGHELVKGRYEPSQGDNAPVMGPAGTAHASMADWAQFAALHLDGARGRGKLLRPESFARLHTPAEGFQYAGGWLVGRDGELSHDGSNTLWHARIRIRPARDAALLTAVNAGGDAAVKAVDDAEAVLLDYHGKHFAGK
jgi:CubicO group peptidase (beta-lactamase class C family)